MKQFNQRPSGASLNFLETGFSSPEFLAQGDLVAIIATARFVSEEDLIEAKACLLRWGFRVVLGQSIGAKHHQFAGSDTARAQDLQWALDHPEVKAIRFARALAVGPMPRNLRT